MNKKNLILRLLLKVRPVHTPRNLTPTKSSSGDHSLNGRSNNNCMDYTRIYWKP